MAGNRLNVFDSHNLKTGVGDSVRQGFVRNVLIRPDVGFLAVRSTAALSTPSTACKAFLTKFAQCSHFMPSIIILLFIDVLLFKTSGLSENRRRRSAFVTTLTELKLIAAAAITGLSMTPKAGHNTPAATGIPTLL